MFETWYLEELINQRIKTSWKLSDYYLLKQLDTVLLRTGIGDLLNSYISIEEIINKKNYDNKVFFSIKWIFDRLALDGYIEIKQSVNTSLYKFSGKINNDSIDELYKKAYEIAPLTQSTFDLIKLVSDNYPDYLEGKKNGVDILFNEQSSSLMNDFYTNNEFYSVNNIGGAKILNYDIDNRINPKILEIGGGMGGGTKQFISQRIANGKPLDNFSYVFTDIANKMLRCTKKEIQVLTNNPIDIEYKKFDFNVDIADQGYETDSFDVIWGVNAAHVAKDLKSSLKRLYSMLKKGGSLILAETVRAKGNPLVQQEYILNTLDSYWDVQLDDDIRPCYGFMHWKNWIKALELSGFTKVETIPDMNIVENKYDNCYVALIRGIK